MFKFRLYPNKTQTKALENTLEICRYAYNQLLACQKASYVEHGKLVSQYDQNLKLTQMKSVNPLLSNVHSQILQNISKRIRDAYTNFFARKKLGLKSGLPRFKKYGKYKSLTFPQSGFKIVETGKRLDVLEMSKIGDIPIRLHRTVEGKVKTLTVKRMPSGKWFAIFSCRIVEQPKMKLFEDVGIDVGLKSFAVLSDGQHVDNPRFYRKKENRLKRLQRRLSRANKGSRNRSKLRSKVALTHEKVENCRKDFLHKTSRMIADRYKFVYVEDLKITNMVKNHCLAKSISDAGWGAFVRMLAYKEAESGGQLVKVNPKGTTQQCSRCKKTVEKHLSDRIHECPFCGLVLDRDLNASRNILRIGRESPKSKPEREEATTQPFEIEQASPMTQEATQLVGW
jgi:putative transposase